MKTVRAFLLVMIVSSVLAGCNTTRGAAEDVEETGENVGEALD